MLVGAVVVLVGVVLFHHASSNSLGNFKAAWQRLKKPTGGAGGTF